MKYLYLFHSIYDSSECLYEANKQLSYRLVKREYVINLKRPCHGFKMQSKGRVIDVTI